MSEQPQLTPSQTVGPFLHIVLPWPDGQDVAAPGTPGLLRVSGRVIDGAGDPVPDGMVETWQGQPPEPVPAGFRGFGRCPTDEQGRWSVHTVKPAAQPAPPPGPTGATEAPHLDISVFARGLLDRVVTRLYFPDETTANAVDPVLSSIDAPRRARLVAAPTPDGVSLDIVLQGDGESVFFNV